MCRRKATSHTQHIMNMTQTTTPSWLMPNNKNRAPVHRTFRRETQLGKKVTHLPTDLDEKTKNAFARAQKSMDAVRAEKEKKKIKVIDFIKEPTAIPVSKKSKTSTTKCAAKTMSGKPCPFAATEGKYCKKHYLCTEFDL